MTIKTALNEADVQVIREVIDRRTGPHPNKALSPAFVRNITEAGMYGDGGCLYLVVEESGTKHWIVRTTIHGKRRDIGLGGLSYVSLAEVREEARRIRQIARRGGDPLAERRKEQRIVPTVKEAALEFFTEQTKAMKNAKHKAQVFSSLETYVYPLIGGLRVDQTTPDDVLKVLRPIWLKTPETARRVRQRTEAIFDYAKASGYRSGDNPVDGISKVLPKQPTGQKHWPALQYPQMQQFMAELHAYEGMISARLAFEFLILTALRTSEVLLAKWPEINLDEKKWVVPKIRMKWKDGGDHHVPLSARAIEILLEAREISDGSEYVFPGARQGRHFSNMALHSVLDGLKRKFYDADGREVTPHGFRSSFTDWAEETTDFQTHVVDAALAHVLSNKVEAAYRRTKLFDKRKLLMDAWAEFCGRPVVAKVVSMVGRA